MAAAPHAPLADSIPSCLEEDSSLCTFQFQQHTTAVDDDHEKRYRSYLNDSSGDISELSPGTIDWAFKNVPHDEWTHGQIGALTQLQLSQLSPEAGDSVSRTMLGKFNSNEISWISPEAFGRMACNLDWLSQDQILGITFPQMSTIDPLCALRLSERTLSYLSQPQICNFSPETFVALSTHLGRFSLEKIPGICLRQIQRIPALAVMNWSRDIIQEISQLSIRYFSPEALEAWALRIEQEGTGLKKLGLDNIASLTSKTIMGMDTATLQTLPDDAIYWLSDAASEAFALRCKEWTQAQVSAVGNNQLPFVRWQDIAELPPEILQSLSSEQLGFLNEKAYEAFLDQNLLTNDQISELDSKRLERIQARHINTLPETLLEDINNDQLKQLNEAAFKAFLDRNVVALDQLSNFDQRQLDCLTVTHLKNMKNEPLAGLWNQIPVMSQEQVVALQENAELPHSLSSLVAARLWQHAQGFASSSVELQESDVWSLPLDVLQGLLEMHPPTTEIKESLATRLSLSMPDKTGSLTFYSQIHFNRIPWEYLNRFTKEQIQEIGGNVWSLSSSAKTSLYNERYDDLTWNQAVLLHVSIAHTDGRYS